MKRTTLLVHYKQHNDLYNPCLLTFPNGCPLHSLGEITHSSASPEEFNLSLNSAQVQYSSAVDTSSAVKYAVGLFSPEQNTLELACVGNTHVMRPRTIPNQKRHRPRPFLYVNGSSDQKIFPFDNVDITGPLVPNKTLQTKLYAVKDLFPFDFEYLMTRSFVSRFKKNQREMKMDPNTRSAFAFTNTFTFILSREGLVMARKQKIAFSKKADLRRVSEMVKLVALTDLFLNVYFLPATYHALKDIASALPVDSPGKDLIAQYVVAEFYAKGEGCFVRGPVELAKLILRISLCALMAVDWRMSAGLLRMLASDMQLEVDTLEKYFLFLGCQIVRNDGSAYDREYVLHKVPSFAHVNL